MNAELTPKPSGRWIEQLRRAASVAVSAFVTLVLQQVIMRNAHYLTAFWDVWWFTMIGTIAVLLAGVGLFLFRKNYRMFYGLSEVGFAIAVGWISLARAQTVKDAASWIAVVAAAYLVIRGLDNYEGGRAEAAKEENRFQISD